MAPSKVHPGSPDHSQAETGRKVGTPENEADDAPGSMWLVTGLWMVLFPSPGSTIAVNGCDAVRTRPKLNGPETFCVEPKE